jgi:hypothetical protein
LRLGRREVLRYAVVAGAGLVAIPLIGCGGADEEKGKATSTLIEGVLPTGAEGVVWREWFGPSDAPAQVERPDASLRTFGGVRPDKATRTLSMEDHPYHGIESAAWAADVERAYFGTRSVSPPYQLVRFNPADNTYTYYTSTSDYRYCNTIVVDNGLVYAGLHHATTAGAFIGVFATTTSPPVLIDTYGPYGDYFMQSIVSDGAYLFVGNANRQVMLIRLADMVLVDTLTLTYASGGLVHAMCYDPVSGFAFPNVQGGASFKIHRSGETLIEDVAYNHGHLAADDVAVAGGYLWLPIATTLPGGQVGYIPISTFDSCTLVACGPAGNYAEGVLTDVDGEHIWVCWYNVTGGQLTRLKVSDLSYERIWLATGEDKPDDIIQYAPGKYLVATWSYPSQIINLTNPFPDTALERSDAPGTVYCDWAVLRGYCEEAPETQVSDLHTYTDGQNILGDGWYAHGARAKNYVQAVAGAALSVANYGSDLEDEPTDIFGWMEESPMTLEGVLDNPNSGDVGEAGVDECFLVLQLYTVI